MGILYLGERQRLRPVRAARHVRALPLVPRVRAARPLQHREPAPHRGDPAHAPSARSSIDYTTRVSESVLVRLHYVVYVEPGARAATSTPREVEMMLVAATRSWADDLEEALVDELGEAQRRRAASSATATPSRPAYRADWVARSALADIVHIEELPDADGLGISLYRPLEAEPRHAAREAVPRRAGR